MIMMMTMKNVKNGDDDDEDMKEMNKEVERERERERERGERRRGNRKGANPDTDPKHLCSCANDSRDHSRLPVPWSKQALSRLLQVQHRQKN